MCRNCLSSLFVPLCCISEIPCDGSFANDEPTNHFTADCSGATAHADTCVLTLSAGYGGGSVTCDDGQYDVVVAIEESEPEEIDFNNDASIVSSTFISALVMGILG